MTKTACAAAAIALLPLAGCGSEASVPEMFSARLESAEVVPPSPGQLKGDVGFSLDGRTISFSADLQNVALAQRPDRFLRLRIHSGARGTNGPPLASSVLPEHEIATAGERFLWQGRLGAAQLDTAGSVEEVVAAMRARRAYVVVTHWQILALGEAGVAAARGQIDAPDRR